MQNLYMICSICGKKHWCKLSYKDIEIKECVQLGPIKALANKV